MALGKYVERIADKVATMGSLLKIKTVARVSIRVAHDFGLGKVSWRVWTVYV
jgi:hypothetical protein